LLRLLLSAAVGAADAVRSAEAALPLLPHNLDLLCLRAWCLHKLSGETTKHRLHHLSSGELLSTIDVVTHTFTGLPGWLLSWLAGWHVERGAANIGHQVVVLLLHAGLDTAVCHQPLRSCCTTSVTLSPGLAAFAQQLCNKARHTAAAAAAVAFAGATSDNVPIKYLLLPATDLADIQQKANCSACAMWSVCPAGLPLVCPGKQQQQWLSQLLSQCWMLTQQQMIPISGRHCL
jgi:hypothetical protein